MNKAAILPILWMMAVSVFSQKLTLSNAIQVALDNNPNIQIARNNAATAENNARIGNAGLLPRFTLTTGATYTADGGQFSDNFGSTTTPTAQLQASYTLFDGLGNVYRLKSLRTGGTLGQAEAQFQIESIIIQVAEGFFQGAQAFENYSIAQTLVQLSNGRYQRALKRSQYGRTRTIDDLSALVDLNADSVILAQAGLLRDQAVRSLNLLLFRDVNTPVSIDTAVVITLHDNLTDLLTKAISGSRALEIARLRKQQARYNYTISKAAHLPQLDLTASYGYTQVNQDLDLTFRDPVRTTRLGAAFSFNLFNGFQTHIERQNARRTYENQSLLADQAVLSIERDLSNAMQAFETSLTVHDLAKRSFRVAQLNFTRTKELYQLGQVTTTQFREAQLNLIRAQSQVSSAKYETKLNELAIQQLTGELVDWESE
jgi:outer membrane protein TolC